MIYKCKYRREVNFVEVSDQATIIKNKEKKRVREELKKTLNKIRKIGKNLKIEKEQLISTEFLFQQKMLLYCLMTILQKHQKLDIKPFKEKKSK